MSEPVRIGDATLYLGDCLEILPTLGKAGAVITDPPYSSGGAFRADRAGSTAKKYMGSYGRPAAVDIDVVGDSRDANGWAFWATLWLTQCYRMLEDGGPCVIFSDWRQLPNATNVLQAAGFVWRGVGVWAKPGYRPMAGRFAHQAEYFPWGTKGATPWDYTKECLPGVFDHAAPGKEREHQTEKPVQLMADLLKVTAPDATTVDPFMGGGTTGVAAVQMGRKFIGIEIEPRNFDIACRRIEQAYAQRPLFAAEPPKPHEQLGLESA
jgi:site-specific DNA-methyltransferase (adenine-specific)